MTQQNQESSNKPQASAQEENQPQNLSSKDIDLLIKYGMGPYSSQIKALEDKNQAILNDISQLSGFKDDQFGLGLPHTWNLSQDQQHLNRNSMIVSKVNKILKASEESNQNNPSYIIQIKQMAKYVVDLHESLHPDDVEEGIRVGTEKHKFQIKIPLPSKIDGNVTMMQVEEKPDVSYSDIGGCKEQIERLKEVVELPLLNPEKFIQLGIDPPKGVLLFGPPGTGKTLAARAVANRSEATFIRVIGSELVQKYIGEGARMVREIFKLAKSKKAAIIFFDEIDAVGGARVDDGHGSENEIQRTMLEIVNQLDGFTQRGNIKVIMATNRPDTLDPALMRPGRLDRKIEFNLPDLEGRTNIFKINAKQMSMEKNIRFEMLARLCPNATGAEIRSVCTEAGMFAIRERRKAITEKDIIKAIDKVIKGYLKFSATQKYMVYN